MKTPQNLKTATLITACLFLFASASFAQRSMKAHHAYKTEPVYVITDAATCIDQQSNPEVKCMPTFPYDPMPPAIYPPDAGLDASVCSSESYQLNGFSPPMIKRLWTTSGDGHFDDPSSLHAVYTPGKLDKANGSVTLVLHIFSPWGYDMVPNFDAMTLTIQNCTSMDDVAED